MQNNDYHARKHRRHQPIVILPDNINSENELDQDSTCAENAQVRREGKRGHPFNRVIKLGHVGFRRLPCQITSRNNI